MSFGALPAPTALILGLELSVHARGGISGVSVSPTGFQSRARAVGVSIQEMSMGGNEVGRSIRNQSAFGPQHHETERLSRGARAEKHLHVKRFSPRTMYSSARGFLSAK